MSILSEMIGDLRSLFYPAVCAVCGGELPDGGRGICTVCRTDVPLTRFWEQADNPVARRFWGELPVVQASAFFYFVEQSGWRRAIHRFKYEGAWRLARDLGRWYGSYLAASPLYRDVETVVPVPLHRLKRIRRGYNQSEYIAAGIAEELGVPVDAKSLVRRVNNPSQTLRTEADRWRNVEGIFAVRRPERLAGRHVLLVDDVLTTGATVISAAGALLDAVPGCRISIAALAVSARRFGIDR